jgi:hypothetical protein
VEFLHFFNRNLQVRSEIACVEKVFLKGGEQGDRHRIDELKIYNSLVYFPPFFVFYLLIYFLYYRSIFLPRPKRQRPPFLNHVTPNCIEKMFWSYFDRGRFPLSRKGFPTLDSILYSVMSFLLLNPGSPLPHPPRITI